MPFFPLGDDNPRRRIGLPVVTYGLMALNILIFLYGQGLPPLAQGSLVYGYGMIPAVLNGTAMLPDELYRLPAWMTPVTYQFLHGGWDHIIGNMIFLWVFGDNVEDSMGHLRYLLFYLLCGVLAGLAHGAMDPDSIVPLIGASGAISGVLGAYLVLHPFARVLVLIVALPLRIPAWILLLIWFGFQFVSLQEGGDDGVAWVAHIGGFLVGALLIFPFKARGVRAFARNEPPYVVPLTRPLIRRRAPSGGQERGRRRPRDEDTPPRGPWG